MTERQVQSILGSTRDQQAVGQSKFYFYQSPDRTADGNLAAKPEYGYVRFVLDKSSTARRPVYVLQTYALPYFETVIEPIIDPEPPVIKQTNSPPAKGQSSEGGRGLPTINRQPREPQPIPPAAPDTFARNGMRYFVGCGILFAVAAFVFAVIQGVKGLGQ